MKNRKKNKKIFVIQTLILVSILLIQLAIPMFSNAGENLTKIDKIEALVNAEGTSLNITVTSKEAPNSSPITSVKVFKKDTVFSEEDAEDEALAINTFNNASSFELYGGEVLTPQTPNTEITVKYDLEEIDGYYYILATNEADETYMSRKKIMQSSGDSLKPMLDIVKMNERIGVVALDNVAIKELRIGEVTSEENSIDFTDDTKYTAIPVTEGKEVDYEFTIVNSVGELTPGTNSMAIGTHAVYQICAIDTSDNMTTTYIAYEDSAIMDVRVQTSSENTIQIQATGMIGTIESVKIAELQADENGLSYDDMEDKENIYKGNEQVTLSDLDPGRYFILVEDNLGNCKNYVVALGKPEIEVYIDNEENPQNIVVKAKSTNGSEIDKIYIVGSDEEEFAVDNSIAITENEKEITKNADGSAKATIAYNEDYKCIGVYVIDKAGKTKAVAVEVNTLREEVMPDTTAPEIISVEGPTPSRIKVGESTTYKVKMSEPVTVIEGQKIGILDNSIYNADPRIGTVTVTGSGTDWIITATVDAVTDGNSGNLVVLDGVFADMSGNLCQNGIRVPGLTVERNNEDDKFDLRLIGDNQLIISTEDSLAIFISASDRLVMNLDESKLEDVMCQATGNAKFHVEECYEYSSDGRTWVLRLAAEGGNGRATVTLPEGLFTANGGMLNSNAKTFTDIIVDNGGTIAEDTTPPTISAGKKLSEDKTKVTMEIEVGDTESLIKTVKIAAGEKTADFFKDGGVTILENGKVLPIKVNYEVKENGKYTIYAEDAKGNKTVKVEEVEEIIIPTTSAGDKTTTPSSTTAKDSKVDTTTSGKLAQLGQSNFIIYEIIVFAIISVISYFKYVRIY